VARLAELHRSVAIAPFVETKSGFFKNLARVHEDQDVVINNEREAPVN
jgi:hypothetical protein